MSKKISEEGMTMMYSINKEEDPSENNTSEISKGVFGRSWKGLKNIFSKDGRREETEQDVFTYDDNEELINQIAKESDVKDIKKNIGSDDVFDDICTSKFHEFKSAIIQLKQLTEEDYIYMIKKIIEYNMDDKEEKIFFIIRKNERILEYNKAIVLNIIPLSILKKMIEYFKFPQLVYKENSDFIYDNKKALFFLNNGLLKQGSSVDLDFVKINELKIIAENYGNDYILPFVMKKFEQTKFLTFQQIKELISIGLDVNVTDYEESSLLWSVKDVHDLKYLLSLGLNINHRNNKGENFLFDYIREIEIFDQDDIELIEVCMENNLNINNINSLAENILFVSAKKTDKKCFQYLFNLQRINYQQRNLMGENILFHIEDQKTIRVLTENYGMDLHIINNNGENLLFNRSLDSVAVMIELGVRRDLVNYNGQTYLEKKK